MRGVALGMPLLMSFSAARRALAIAMAGPVAGRSRAGGRPRRDRVRRAPRAGGGRTRPGDAGARKALGPQGLVSSDPRTGTIRAAGRLDGALTGPSGKDGAVVALDYVRAHGSALGLPSGSIPGLAPEQRTVTPGRPEVLTTGASSAQGSRPPTPTCARPWTPRAGC